jgi:hypothetical protein
LDSIDENVRRQQETGGTTMSDRFWDEVAPLQAAGRLEEGTMFGFRCVRAGKDFVAMPGHESDGMVVKLPAARVTELLASGKGMPVAPAGKIFKEWVEVAASEEWRPYLDEALEFAGD